MLGDHMCDELGIATGVDLEALIQCAILAEYCRPFPPRLGDARWNPCPAARSATGELTAHRYRGALRWWDVRPNNRITSWALTTCLR